MTTSLTYKAAAAVHDQPDHATRRSPGCRKDISSARIVTSNVNYAASPSLSFSNLIQYDNRSRNLGWQSRVRWTLQPGNDLFFAFNQGWVQEEDRKPQPAVQGRGQRVSAKFQYSYRF